MQEMAQAVVLYVNLQVDKAFPRTISSKVSDCMAVGGPIPAGVSRSILESPGANVCLEMGKQEDVGKVLVTLVAEYDGLCQETRGNPEVIRNDYTREKAAGILRDVFRLVTSNGRVVPTRRS